MFSFFISFLSLRLLFFLPFSFSFFNFSLPHLLSVGSSSSSPICSGFVIDLHLHTADTSHPVFHVTAHPTLTSLVFHFTADPSSTANPSFIVNPSSIGIAFIKLKRTVRLIKVEMRQRNLALVVWLDFMGLDRKSVV